MESGESGPGTGAVAPDEGPDAVSSAAFQRLFELHFPELYRFAYRYVRAEEAAKDLVGEAFLQLWRQRDQVDLSGSTARSYLYTIVRYRALDYLRRRRVEERWRREYVTPLITEQGAALAADPDQEFTARETAAAIQQAVDALPQRQRQVLLLRWQQQASYDEIAETLGISPKTVAIHIGRAIQRLREILTQVR
jgi:RNA polymerase sigma-70 factor (ECF subfamily)